MSQDMINLGITCAGAVIGWFLKAIWEALRDLKHDIREIENELHINYVRRDDMQKNFDDVRADLREIFEVLRTKVDK